MELWIRSQDKMNLVKVNQININYQNNKQIIANAMPDFSNSDSLYYELLGTYKSKEKALEVLDEIQDELISSSYFPGNLKEEFLVCGSARVYEMPEE